MTMTIWQGAITIVTVVLGTMCTRFLPFLVFGGKKEVPGYITYLSGVLPYAIMGMLVVYCLKNVSFFAGSHGIPEIAASAVVVGPSGTHRLHRHRAAARMETQYAAFNRRRHNCIYVAGATGVLRHPTR